MSLECRVRDHCHVFSVQSEIIYVLKSHRTFTSLQDRVRHHLHLYSIYSQRTVTSLRCTIRDHLRLQNVHSESIYVFRVYTEKSFMSLECTVRDSLSLQSVHSEIVYYLQSVQCGIIHLFRVHVSSMFLQAHIVRFLRSAVVELWQRL